MYPVGSGILIIIIASIIGVIIWKIKTKRRKEKTKYIQRIKKYKNDKRTQ